MKLGFVGKLGLLVVVAWVAVAAVVSEGEAVLADLDVAVGVD